MTSQTTERLFWYFTYLTGVPVLNDLCRETFTPLYHSVVEYLYFAGTTVESPEPLCLLRTVHDLLWLKKVN